MAKIPRNKIFDDLEGSFGKQNNISHIYNSLDPSMTFSTNSLMSHMSDFVSTRRGMS